MVTPYSGDGGYDILIKTDTPIGVQTFLVECKRNSPKRKVDVSIVRSLLGVVSKNHVNGGVIVTTSLFTRGAKLETKSTPLISLKDYSSIKKWVVDY